MRPHARARTFGALLLAVHALLAAAGAQADSVEIAARVEDQAGKPVADAVVIAMPADGKVTLPSRPREEMIDQVDKEFTPRVKVVVVGTPVTFPNHDDVRHHVYSFSPAKRFEVPLYAGRPAQPVLFDKAGVVVLGCNIHDWMVGYVYVSESPYFGKTDASGRVVLAVPAGQPYVLHLWHPQQDGAEDATRRTVDLTHAHRAEVAWTVTLKPEIRVRRAPVAGHGSNHY